MQALRRKGRSIAAQLTHTCWAVRAPLLTSVPSAAPTFPCPSFNLGWLCSFKVGSSWHALPPTAWQSIVQSQRQQLLARMKVSCSALLGISRVRRAPSTPDVDCSLQAISWALNRGALCMLRFTPAQFVAVYLTPVTPAATDDQVVAPASAAAPSDSTSQASRPGLRRRAGATINAKLGSGSGSGASLAGTNSSKVGGGATLPRRGSQGRLNEDAGGWEVQAAKWGAKLAFIALIVVVLQYPLPGLLESFAYGEGQGVFVCLGSVQQVFVC